MLFVGVVVSIPAVYERVPFFGSFMAGLGAGAVAMGVVVLVGTFLINSGDESKVKTGSVLVLVFSVLSILMGGGFLVGFILGIVGGALGLSWKPSARG